jgi:predicted MFS family arabinose efflux permease
MIIMCMALAGWTIFFGAYTEDVFSISANALSLLFLAGGIANLIGCSLAPALMRKRQPRGVYVLATLAMSGSLLLVSLVGGDWWMVLPFAVSIGITNTVLYLTVSVLLLESMPSNRGAVMSLQTGCFEFGWAMGSSVTGVMLTALGSYAAVHQVLGLFLLLSLASLALSARRARVSSIERVGPQPGVAA